MKSSWVLAFVLMGSIAMAAKKAAPKKPEEPIDWGAKAQAELDASQAEPVKQPKKKASSKPLSAAKQAEPPKPAPTPIVDQVTGLPTPATVIADVSKVRPAIERTALRVTLQAEPYKPSGQGRFGSETIDYGALSSTVLGQLDMRWLPWELDGFVMGGYAAFGYSRQTMPLVAPSGFRYDDVALNTMRVEAGVGAGKSLSENWNLEAKIGIGRLSQIQTSKYSDAVGTFERTYGVLGLDASYYLTRKFALIGGIATRTGLSDGTGNLGIDPFTVSGGLLVQVR